MRSIFRPFHALFRAALGLDVPESPAKPETGDRNPETTRRNRAAFTLIELIAVMGIIVALALVVGGSYAGIATSIAEGQASRQFRDALLLARQTACVNGSRTYVYLLGEDEYVICRRIGTSCGTSGKSSYQQGDPLYRKDSYVFYDYYTDLSSFVSEVDRNSEQHGQDSHSSSSQYHNSDLSSEMNLFDLSSTEARYGILRGVDSNDDLGFGWNLYWQPRAGECHNNSYFAENHDYGISIYPVRHLPKGYVFATEIGTCVYFEPTGMTGPKTGSQSFIIAKAAMKNNPSFQRKVTVDHSGKVDVEEPK